jgi:predicted flavoprotein YhiN
LLVIPATWESETGGSQVQLKTSPGKVSETLSQKQNEKQMDWGMAQVIECLPSRHEVEFNMQYCKTTTTKSAKKDKKKKKIASFLIPWKSLQPEGEGLYQCREV